MTDYHEPLDVLSSLDKDVAKALTSLKEEIEAVNWYHQRAAVCSDAELKEVLSHNRDEEIEHACMLMEWLRRNVPEWNEQMKTYFFTEKPITEIEEDEEGEAASVSSETESRPAAAAGIGVGSLKSPKPQRG